MCDSSYSMSDDVCHLFCHCWLVCFILFCRRIHQSVDYYEFSGMSDTCMGERHRDKILMRNLTTIILFFWGGGNFPLELSPCFPLFHKNGSKMENFNRRPVSSVGRASDYRAGGLGFESQTGPTLRVLK